MAPGTAVVAAEMCSVECERNGSKVGLIDRLTNLTGKVT